MKLSCFSLDILNQKDFMLEKNVFYNFTLISYFIIIVLIKILLFVIVNDKKIGQWKGVEYKSAQGTKILQYASVAQNKHKAYLINFFIYRIRKSN